MDNHLEQLKLTFNYFRKNKLLYYIYIAMVVITVLGILFFTKNSFNTSFLINTFFGQFGFYINTAFFIISFLFFIKYLTIEETIYSIRRENTYRKYSLILMLLLSLLYNILVIVLLLINMKSNNLLSYFLYILKSSLMNIFLPQIIGLFITYLLSFLAKSYTAYLLFIFFIFISSPYGELNFSEKPILPFDKVYNFIRMPFSFFIQNGKVSMDTLYGFQNEEFKIYIFLFWILLTLTIISVYYLKKNRKVILIALSISTILSFIGIYKPQSTLRFYNNWDKQRYDNNYYLDKDIEYDNSVPYRISHYDMKFDFDRQLNARGELTLESDIKQKEYVFTLYSKYKIKDISSDKAIESYKRDHDYIYITFKDEISNAIIDIKYEGYHDNLYSNKNAILLPGYFAWYPMAGRVCLYSRFDTHFIALYGYNETNTIDKAYFDIEFNTDCDIITNLEMIDHNHYEGYTNGMTLIGGITKETNDELFINYFPLEVYKGYSQYDIVDEWKEKYQRTIKRLQDIYGLDTHFLENKPIIVLPDKLMYRVTFGGLAIFDDHIVFSSNSSFNTTKVFENLIVKNGNMTFLKEMFMLMFDSENSEEFMEYYVNSVLELPVKEAYKIEKLKNLRNSINDKDLVKEITDYVIGNSQFKNDDDFLKGMYDKYVKDR